MPDSAARSASWSGQMPVPGRASSAVGATFRGYEAYVVQDLLIQNNNTRYLRARYELPGGGSVLAPFPVGVLPIEGGHFGANLIAYVLDQYHQAHVTEPVLLEQLWEYGIDISSGQLHHILTENKAAFHQEKDEVLVAGLTEASYIGTDVRDVRLASAGTLLGGLIARGVAPDLGILSDGAPQFVILVHAACWVHAERPLAKLVPHNDAHRVVIDQVRTQIWELYQDLK